MKYRESGMPEEKMWNTFFDPTEILGKMGVNDTVQIFMDIGCGYGTFLLPASKIVKEKAVGIDIEEEMIRICRNNTSEYELSKLDLILGDISSEKPDKSLETYREKVDYISLFNILHCEAPIELLRAAYSLLKPNGKVGVIHWNYEETPRGPSMEIRPTPDNIIGWATKVGLHLDNQMDLKPYHYGLVFHK